jgi:hypothetical protein
MARDIAGDRLIIQADGVPMSGGSDDLNTTLQAVAIADIIQKDLIEKDKNFKNLPILLSGGTNSFTGELANSAKIKYGGISMGTHARKIVKECEYDEDAILLTPKKLISYFSKIKKMKLKEKKYYLFIPQKFRFLNFIEKYLSWFPIGGQYFLVFNKK